MDEAQFEIGFWPGNDAYTQPAYFAFMYPQPDKIEQAVIQPKLARWDNQLMEFVLDYAAVRAAKNPEDELLNFFNSTFTASSALANWDKKLMTKGEPV